MQSSGWQHAMVVDRLLRREAGFQYHPLIPGSLGEAQVRFAHISAAEEREFEREHISSLRETYLRTDVLKRVENDAALPAEHPPYRARAQRDARSSSRPRREYMRRSGGAFHARLLNRCSGCERSCTRHLARTRRRVPRCAADLRSWRRPSSPAEVPVGGLGVLEVLHHLERPEIALFEANRVLAPAGGGFSSSHMRSIPIVDFLNSR